MPPLAVACDPVLRTLGRRQSQHAPKAHKHSLPEARRGLRAAGGCGVALLEADCPGGGGALGVT